MNSTSKPRTAPLPNTLGRGRVTRTMWPPAAGTQRWQAQYGIDMLLCVRHRADPAGLRRVVTVELVVGEVATRRTQRRLVERTLYPLLVGPQERALRTAILAHGGRWDPDQRLWYLTGAAVDSIGLLDRIAIDRQPRRRTRSAG